MLFVKGRLTAEAHSTYTAKLKKYCESRKIYREQIFDADFFVPFLKTAR